MQQDAAPIHSAGHTYPGQCSSVRVQPFSMRLQMHTLSSRHRTHNTFAAQDNAMGANDRCQPYTVDGCCPLLAFNCLLKQPK